MRVRKKEGKERQTERKKTKKGEKKKAENFHIGRKEKKKIRIRKMRERVEENRKVGRDKER